MAVALTPSDVAVLILAGGAGRRLWPLSRPNRPKPLLDWIDGTPMLRAAVTRVPSWCPADRVFVSVAADHVAAVRDVLPELGARCLLVEPDARDTGPALALAVARIEALLGPTVVLVLAADHDVRDADALHRSLAVAAHAASTHGTLVSLGVVPDHASSQYGYMACDPRAEVSVITRYVEKPPPAVAQQLARDGRHLWNAGIFAWRTDTLLDAYARCAPDDGAALDAMRVATDDDARVAAFRAMQRRSIDHAVMERLDGHTALRSVAVACDPGWADVGTFASFHRHVGSPGEVVTRGDVVHDGCDDCVLIAEAPWRIEARDLGGLAVVVGANGDALVAPLARTAGALPELRGVVRVDVDGFDVTVEGTTLRVARRASRVHVCHDADAMHERATAAFVERMREILAARATALVTCSAGRTPSGVYRRLVERHRGDVDWSRVVLAQMDEYLDLDAEHPARFAHALDEALVRPLGIGRFLRLRAPRDLRAVEAEVRAHGGFDLALHGVGENGHLGFNEPGSDPTGDARVVTLSDWTRCANAELFATWGMVPRRGMTLGLRSLAGAHRVLLLACGTRKAVAMDRFLRGPASRSLPVSALRDHPGLEVFLDRAAHGEAVVREGREVGA